MRRLAGVLLSLVLLLCSVPGAYAAAAAPVSLTFDGRTVTAGVVTENGRSLISARALGEALGFVVSPTEADGRISLIGRDTRLELWVNSTRAVAGGNELTLDTPTRKLDGEYYVPVRFVAERFGVHVRWDAAAQSIILTTSRAMLKQILQAQSKWVDEEISADLTLTLPGGNLGAAKLFGTDELPMHMDIQVYKNDMLLSGSFNAAGDMAALLNMFTIRMAVKDGVMWAQDPTTGRWEEQGPYTPAAGATPGAGAVSELGLNIPSPGFDQQMVEKARVAFGGEDTLEGVRVVRVDVDLANADPVVVPTTTEAVPGLATVGSTTVQVDRLHASYWFDPAGQFLYKTAMEYKATSAVTLGTKTLKTTVNMSAEMRFKPFTGPIQFPDFTADPTALSPKKREELAGYWAWIQEKADPSPCMQASAEALASWGQETTGGREAAAEANRCFAAMSETLAAKNAPQEFADAHATFRQGADALAAAMDTLVKAYDLATGGDREAAGTKHAEAQAQYDKGMRQMVQGMVKAVMVAEKFGLEGD